MSACPYCATALPGGVASEPNEYAARLQKIVDSDGYAAAMTFTPQEGPEFESASAQVRRGVILAVVGLIVFLWGARLLAVVLLGVAVWQALTGWRKRTELLTYPLVRRPAVVTDRRSETAFNGYSSRVFYQFTLELPENARGEFRFPGRGWSYSPLNRGASGVAYTRGANLVDFKSIKS